MIRDRVVVFSRDELKQYEARQLFGDDPRLRWFIGDIRDRDRLKRAMHGVQLRRARGRAQAGRHRRVQPVRVRPDQRRRARRTSSTPRSTPASRRSSRSPPTRRPARSTCTARPSSSRTSCSSSANHYAAHHPTRFAVVRYGNVMGSRGSVIPFFRQLAARGQVAADHRQADDPVLDHASTQAVQFVVDSFEHDARRRAVRAADPEHAHRRSGRGDRAGGADARDRHPARREAARRDDLARRRAAARSASATATCCSRRSPTWGYTPPATVSRCRDDFAYRSDTNDLWLSVDDLRSMLATVH